MSIVVGEHPIWMTTILVAGSTAHLVVPSEEGVLGAPQLEFAVGRADAAPVQTYPLALVSGEWMVTLTAAQVAALSGAHFARVTDGGRTIAAGYVQYNPGWEGGSSRVVTSSRIIYGGGDGGGGGGVTDHGALTGLTDDDHQQYALADGTRGDFAPTSHGHVLADISDYTAPDLSGLVADDDPRLSDARTPTAHDHDDRYAPALGPDDNYVTDAEKTALHSHSNKAALDLVSGVNTGDQTLASLGAAPAVQPINAQTGTSYTLQASDAGKLVALTNTDPITLTVPPGLFVAGQRVDCSQRGDGAVTVIGGVGVTLNPMPGMTLVSEGKFAAWTVLFHSSTEADVIGWMAAA